MKDLSDYYRFTPRERADREKTKEVLVETGWIRPKAACSRTGSVTVTTARPRDPDPVFSETCQENSGSQSTEEPAETQKESVDSGVSDTGVSLPTYPYEIRVGWRLFK
jgi:hypothetical protein